MRAAGQPPYKAEIAKAVGKILIVISIAGFVSYQTYRTATDTWLQTAESFSVPLAAYAEQTLIMASDVLKDVVHTVEDAGIDSEDKLRQARDSEAMFRDLRNLSAGTGRLDVAALVALDGTLLNFSRSFPAPSLNVADRAYHAAALALHPGEVALSDPFTSRLDGEWLFLLSSPIFGKDKKPIGVAYVGTKSKHLGDVFGRMALGADSAVAVFKDNGYLLARGPDPDGLVGARYADAPSFRLAAADPAPKPVILSTLVEEPIELSRRRIAVARKLSSFPVIVTLVIGDNLFLQTWWRTNWFVAVASLVIILMILASTRRTLRLLVRQQATQRREREHQVLAAIVETPTALTAVLNSQGDVVHANRRFREAFGRDRELDRHVLKNPDMPGARAVIELATGLTEPSSEGADIEIELGQGSLKSFLRFSAARQSLDGLGNCLVLVGHDETAQRQTRLALAQAAKLVTLGEMATGVAHELNQPLNVISMTAQTGLLEIEAARCVDGLAGEGELRRAHDMIASLGKSLKRIEAQTARAAAIIGNMRIFGRVPDAALATFDVRDACRQALDLVRDQLGAANVVVRLQLGDRKLPVRGSQNMLEQVVVNLAINARDVLSNSNQLRKLAAISTRLDQATGKIVVRVADNGPGVPDDVRDRIFEPFFTTKPVGGGMGLGLAISYGIVKDMGGTLRLVPSSEGAVFEIVLAAATE
jgi:C4-dicarboxylate-specific signal transduction histidine kinase